MKRAAIYARFSSDRQKDRSIEDQVALCRDTGAREGFAIIHVFEDRALSGASTANRPGFLELMRAARSRAFDVLIVEDIDRLARDQADFHDARRTFDFNDIAIHTATGKVSRIDGSLRALMSELYIENLATHTRRGLLGVVRDGRHPGGKAYGYKAVDGKPGELAIVEAEAAIVREIFSRYAGGDTPREIAGDLNARGIKPSRAAAWNASTINGNHARKSGMLFNELYIGRIIWNRQRMPKDPATGNRVARPNAAADHIAIEAPALRIIDDDLWRRVQAVKARRHHEKPSAARKPPRLLSGLIKCSACGSGMSAVARDRSGMKLQCSAYRERSTCTNKRMVYRDAVERIVLDGLRDTLKDSAYLEGFARAYNAERNRLRKQTVGDRARIERRAVEIDRELGRAFDAIVKTWINPATFGDRIKQLETEKAAVAAQLAGAAGQDRIVSLHPVAIERYRHTLDAISTLIERDGHSGGAGELAREIRKLIARIVIHAAPGRAPVRIEVIGRLAELLGLPETPVSRGEVVAGVGFEPTTFRL